MSAQDARRWRWRPGRGTVGGWRGRDRRRREEDPTMRHSRWGAAAAALALWASAAGAADLPKVDRTIGKEPAYTTKQPRYCLLVFGPRAGFKVWLVQDGNVLYVDRNGNGDLTE